MGWLSLLLPATRDQLAINSSTLIQKNTGIAT